MNTFVLSGSPDLERATYSWPWLNTGSFKYTPTLFRVCPWALLIVIANANRIGNCRLVIVKGYALLVLSMDIRGIKTSFPLCTPNEILQHSTLLDILVTVSRVPLNSPSFTFKFLNNIIGQFTFKDILCKGNHLELRSLEILQGNYLFPL